MRILFDPTGMAGGGGGSVAPEATPATAPANPVQSTAPAAPAIIPVSVEEWQRLRAADQRLTLLAQEQEANRQKAESERLQALADKGKAEEILGELRKKLEETENTWKTKHSELETSYHSEKRAAAVATGLAGVQFVSDVARDQALELLNARLAVTRSENGVVVVDKLTGRPASAVIPELLASPDFAHFQRPKTSGGSGANGGDRPAPYQEAPTSFFDQVVANFNGARQGDNVPSWQRPAKITRN